MYFLRIEALIGTWGLPKPDTDSLGCQNLLPVRYPRVISIEVISRNPLVSRHYHIVVSVDQRSPGYVFTYTPDLELDIKFRE